MPSQFIFRSQLNDFLQAIIESTIPPEAFEFSKDLSNTTFKFDLPLTVIHRVSRFYFDVSFYRGPSSGIEVFRLKVLPGPEPRETNDSCDTWDQVVSALSVWLGRVQRELSQPDPWVLLNQGTILKDTIPTLYGRVEKFNEVELSKVHDHLKSIREFLLSETDPSHEQLRLIDERLSYLEDSAKRQSKQDWAHTAVGVMFTIAIGLAMAPEQANKLLQLTANFIKLIFVPLLE